MMWSLAPCRDLVVRRARPEDAAGLARIQVDCWRETYPGMIAQAHLDRLSVSSHERHWRRRLSGRGWAFLAIVAGQIVGIASGGACRSLSGFTGELHVLYLLRSWHGRGIGRALFDVVHYELAAQGHDDMLIWVLAANAPARAFYEHLGGVPVGKGSCVIAGDNLKEIAYGWWD